MIIFSTRSARTSLVFAFNATYPKIFNIWRSIGFEILNRTSLHSDIRKIRSISCIVFQLLISSTGKASCYGYVEPYSGYSVNLTVELQRDGDTIKTWTGSGSSDFAIDKIYYVTPNHDYQVVVTANIRNSNGVLVGTPSVKSTVQSY